MKFELSEDQISRFSEWNKKHLKKCPFKEDQGTIGGRLTFSFTPTGVGCVEKVKCACGAEIELSEDIDW